VSVVVATHNRAHLLPRLIRALEAQEGIDGAEVVIVDDASSDDTVTVLDRLARDTTLNVTPVHLEQGRGPGGARNAGWRRASGDLVAFTDDDCEPQSGWLAGLLDGFSNADIVQGRTRPAPDQQDAHGAFGRTISVPRQTGYYQTCNIAYRRSVLESVGGFDEALRQVGEDIDLALRSVDAGARTTFRSDAVVHHDVRPSNWWVHVRTSWRWQGLPLVIRRHPEVRQLLVKRVFWKPSHPPAITAAAGMVIGSAVRGRLGVLIGLASLWPYARYRLRDAPLTTKYERRVALLPAALAADLNEVAVLAVGSVRHRCLML
jgi:glycosyltransferase involved in cell wall biosynthesis